MDKETKMNFEAQVKTEKDLIEWARRIKEDRQLSFSALSADISPSLGKVGKPYSTAYISNALNLDDQKTNGVKIAMAIIAFYEGIQFDDEPYFKVA